MTDSAVFIAAGLHLEPDDIAIIDADLAHAIKRVDGEPLAPLMIVPWGYPALVDVVLADIVLVLDDKHPVEPLLVVAVCPNREAWLGHIRLPLISGEPDFDAITFGWHQSMVPAHQIIGPQADLPVTLSDPVRVIVNRELAFPLTDVTHLGARL